MWSCRPPSSLFRFHLVMLSLLFRTDSFMVCSNSLQELTIGHCRNLVCLSRNLSTFRSIQKLDISCCDSLESLPDGFHKATSLLRTLSLLECPKLVVLEECGFPTALTHLTISNCLQMKAVSNLRLTKTNLSYTLDTWRFSRNLHTPIIVFPNLLRNLQLGTSLVLNPYLDCSQLSRT
uniref:Uncharacterized protein n=1 Tax=Kalanchoe fedtschenkoi TaxID=63787 RepID=A0A7N0TXI4_KALFE